MFSGPLLIFTAACSLCSQASCLMLGPAPARGHHPLPVLGQAPLPEEGRVRLDHLPRPDQRPDLLHHPLGHLPLCFGQVHRLIGILLQVKQEHQVRGGCLIHGLSVGFSSPLPDNEIHLDDDDDAGISGNNLHMCQSPTD